MKILRVEIAFPLSVELSSKHQQALLNVVSDICKENVKPGRVMWPAEYGQKMLTNPFMHSDDEPLEFDEDIFFIGVCEREDYNSQS